MAREGDRGICRHCGEPIHLELLWSGKRWLHDDGGTWCFTTEADPVRG